MSYAVIWAENGDPVKAGKLVLHFDRLVFEGGEGASSVRRELPFASIRAVAVERGRDDRLDGRRVAVLETDANRFKLASLAGAGELNELVGLLSAAIGSMHGAAA